MNIFFLTIIILILIYLFLSWFAKSSSKKLSNYFRKFIIFSSIILAILAVVAGRYIFSLPFLLAILPLIKTKAGITLLQFIRLWTLIKTLQNSGRFNFNNSMRTSNTTMSRDEACKILNLDPNKKYSKEEILSSYKKIMKKIHPDVSPELNRLASIVNEAKEVLTK
tara:strand:- start:93 stop:590 length:498 start_codon:yes stop_codon:yes gene_type:complete